MRTAGSSIEKAIQGQDQASISGGLPYKHMLAATAKEIYAEYWDDYFKFSFVRNPWDRMVSALLFSDYYGVRLEGNKINVDNYIKNHPTFEVDPRTPSAEHVKSLTYHIPNAVYLNILNADLDFIGKFENLHEDFNTVCEQIGIKTELPHIGKDDSPCSHQHYSTYYDDETIKKVENVYKKDIEAFGWSFDDQRV